MRPGKLPSGILSKLLSQVDRSDPRVLMGPKIGEDAAIIDFGDSVLVAKTDPITLATDHIGWYAVHINANDIACTGAIPKWFMSTILIPENYTKAQVSEIFNQILYACETLNISLIGGHTEITRNIKAPIVVGCMLGEVKKSKMVTTGGASDGDTVLLTKGIAIEGTAVIAREIPESLISAGLDKSIIDRAAELLFYPGISVVNDAAIAFAVGCVNAMHDPTEGGVSAGLWEMSDACNMGIKIHQDKIPILPECKLICNALGIDPLRLLASGALLIAVSATKVATITNSLHQHGISVCAIGEICSSISGVQFYLDGKLNPQSRSEQDELTITLEKYS